MLITPEITEEEPIVIEILSLGKLGMAIGIGPESYPLENGIGIDSLSFAIGGSGRVWHGGVGKDYGRGFQKGDKIHVQINKEHGCVAFNYNGHFSNWAFIDKDMI